MRSKYVCIVCQNHKDKDDAKLSNRTLFNFPSSPNRREVWIETLDIKDVPIKTRSRVCEIHFSKKQFIRDRLKPGAVPSLTARSERPKPCENVEIIVPALFLTRVSVVVAHPACNESNNGNGRDDNPTKALSIPSSSSAAASAPSGLPKALIYSVTSHPVNANETPAFESDDEPIPESLKQFLLNSLKTEVATQVLKDSPSLQNFCDKFLSEIRSWKRNKLKTKEDSRQEQISENIQFQDVEQIHQEIVTKTECVEEDPLLQFAYPDISLKIEEDGCSEEVKVEPNELDSDIDDYDSDPLGFEREKGDKAIGTKQGQYSQQEFMEWHDESVEEPNNAEFK